MTCIALVIKTMRICLEKKGKGSTVLRLFHERCLSLSFQFEPSKVYDENI